MDKYFISTALVTLIAVIVYFFIPTISFKYYFETPTTMSSNYSKSWENQLDKINPSAPNRIPAIFLAHGCNKKI